MKKLKHNVKIGDVFGKLTVLEKVFIKNRTHYLCMCECGHSKTILHSSLVTGNTKSCGCTHPTVRHGMCNTRFYRIWNGIIQRCTKPKCNTYCNYGAKGITISDSWLNFEKFKEDMYESYIKHVEEFGEKQTTIDRIDSRGNYCKENCRWAIYSIQTNNTKVNNRNTSGYKGVSYRNQGGHNKYGGWRSYVIIGENHKELFLFSTKKILKEDYFQAGSPLFSGPQEIARGCRNHGH